MPELLDPTAAARKLGMSKSRLKYLRRRKRGPRYIQDGRIILYSEAALAEWAEQRTVRPGVEG